MDGFVYVLSEEGTARPRDIDNPQLGWLQLSEIGLQLALRWGAEEAPVCQHGDCYSAKLPASAIVCALRMRERYHIQHVERLGAYCQFHAAELSEGFFCGRPVMLIPVNGGGTTNGKN